MTKPRGLGRIFAHLYAAAVLLAPVSSHAGACPGDPRMERLQLPHLRAALAVAKVKPAARAETLSLEESAALFRALRDNRNGS